MGEFSFLECINLLSSHHASLGGLSRSDGNQKLDITTWQQFLVQESSAVTSKKVKRYKQICLDGLLKAKNYSADENWEGSGKDLLQSEAFSLTLQDQQEISEDLLECLEKLPDDNGTNAIIKFLVALKGSGGDRGKVKQGFQEMGDCIEIFKRIRLDSSSSDYGSGVKAYQTKFNFKAFSSDRDPEVSGSKPYKIYTKKDFELSSKSRDSSGSSKSNSSYPVPPVFSPDNDALKQFDGCEQRDEGYSSPVPANLQSPQGKGGDIWDCVLAGQASPIYTWEYFGQDPQAGKKQKPFASEAEGQTVHNLWKKCMESLQTVYPDLNIPVLCMVSEPTLCTHICYLLTGIQSESFTYNKITKMFEMRPGLCIQGLSPDSLASLCQKYLQVGAIYRHIYNFLNAQREKPWSRTVVGFCAGIHKYVDLHSSSCIYIASRVQTLGKLVESVRPLVQQLDMIGSICKVRQDPQGWVQLPTGIELLSLLLQVSVHVCQEKETLILISLFKSAVEPYFRFLKRWLFSGECERSYKEFGLKMDMRYVTNRTVDYWNLTHCLAQMNDSGEATAFLADIQEKVFRTGKSLSLLKIIAPNHHLCGRFREIQPNFVLAVTNDEQNNLRINVDKYTSTVEKRTQDEAQSWQQRREKQKREEIEQAKLVIQRNNEELERLRLEKEEKEKEKRRKQKERHEEILFQMEQSKLKKEEDRKKRKREEELIQEEADKIAEEAKRREKEEMERIRQFYERLEREAEDRERRADWRLRRNNPSFKYRRMLLHKELHEEELNRLAKIKYPLNTSHGLIEEELISGEGIVTEIKGVSLEADQEGNYIIVCTDSQGNRIELGLDTLDKYESPTKESTADVMEIIKSQPYLQLPIQIRTLICEAVEYKQLENCNKFKKRKPSTQLSPFPDRKLDTVPHILNQRKSSIADYLYQDGYTTEYPDKNGNMSGTEDGVDSPNSPTAKSRRHSQQIERILYPQRYFTSEAEKIEFKRTDIQLKITGKPLPYTKSFPELKQPSKQEIDTTLPILETTTFPPLSLILQNSILVPLRAQQKLVDAALLSQLLVDYKLEDHLIALQRYLFLADGEFGRQLVISMCMLGKELNPAAELAGELHQHLVENAPVPALLCPGSLNRVLEAAIAASQEGAHDPLAWNLTFALKDKSDYNLCIPGLSLGYRVSWPCNILLTQEVLSKYSSVLEFMVNIRTCLVSLELDWGHQNLVLRHQRKSSNFQQHRLNIMRHEMLNFVRNLHSYVTSQVLEVSWIEFQENLHNKVTNLDELIIWHNKYLNRVLFRCLLNQKAAPVMKFIKMIFQAINKFTSLICTWREPGDQQLWDQIIKQYAAFERTSKFFFNLVTKLMVRGYDTHFQDLLTRLNFNGYYTTSLDSSSSLSVISSGSNSSTTINSLP